jgi:ABC-2 type transport system permease protein
MSTPSNAMPDSSVGAQTIASPLISPVRQFFWLVRREFWENRAIYMAPLASAGFVFFGFLLSMITLSHRIRTAETHDLSQLHDIIVIPYFIAVGLILFTAVVVTVFYCLDALYGERRDRSILFWKSMPVSDLNTVLAKAFIPIVVLQLLPFAIVVATQTLMLLLNSAALVGSGQSAAALWTQLALFQTWMVLLYHLVTVHMLWYAPIYCWLLLVSAWARRTPFLWAFLPPIAICVVEKIVFNTSYFCNLLKYRLTGPAESVAMHADPGAATSYDMRSAMMPIPLGKFLSTPGLWIGLLFAAAFLYAAARMRRYRDPI